MDNLVLKEEIANLKSYIKNSNSVHQEKISALETSHEKQNNLCILKFSQVVGKYNQLSNLYSNLQEKYTISEKRNSHLQEQLDTVLNENRNLIKKVSTLEQSCPFVNSIDPPLDLRLCATEKKPPEIKEPEIVDDLVII